MKILYNPKTDKEIKHLDSIKNKKDFYKKLEERECEKVKQECFRCPVCGEFIYTYNDIDLERITNIDEKIVILKYEIIQGYFLKKKVPVVYKFVYNCKKCGAIYETEEVNMEAHVCLLKK